MSHHVLARKWRPQTFADLAGQEHVVQALTNALEQQRLHHAYLFSGTRGVGKTTIGRILARSLNCEEGVTATPCGVCSSCQEITQGRSLDLIEVDAASRTKVDDTRELLENVQFAPTQSRYKIYLIDEVHMLSNSSFNALLKTIEEPPEHVIFLFATTHPQKIPPTVLSRCLQFHLKNMTVEQIAGHLQHVLTEETVQFETDALFEIARAAAGSMRDALSLTEQAIAFGGGSVSRSQVQDMLGAVDATLIFDLLDALFELNAEAALTKIREYASQAVDFGLLLDELLSVLHRLALVQTVPASLSKQPDADRLQNLAQRVSPDDVQLFYQTVIQCKRDFPLAPDPLTGLEMMALRLIGFRQVVAAELAALQLTAGASGDSKGEPPAKKPDTVTQPCVDSSAESNMRPRAESSMESGIKSSPGVNPQLNAPVSESSDPLKKDVSPNANVDQLAEVGSETQAQESKSAPLDTSALSTSPTTDTELPDVASLTNPLWCEIFSTLPLSGVVRAVASQCVLLSVEQATLKLALLEDNAALYKPDSATKLAAGLSIYFGQTLSCHIELVGSLEELKPLGDSAGFETPADYRQRKQEEKTAQAIDALANDSNVKTLIETFDASLDEDSIEFISKDA